jgi:hypothetical protein
MAMSQLWLSVAASSAWRLGFNLSPCGICHTKVTAGHICLQGNKFSCRVSFPIHLQAAAIWSAIAADSHPTAMTADYTVATQTHEATPTTSTLSSQNSPFTILYSISVCLNDGSDEHMAFICNRMGLTTARHGREGAHSCHPPPPINISCVAAV